MNPGLFSGLAGVLSHEEWRGELIARYRLCAEQQARSLGWLYPGEDVELQVMTALYLAAFTYEPGRGSSHFAVWLRHKIRGQLSAIKRRHNRATCRVRQLRSDWTRQIDDRLYYREAEL